MKSIILPLLFVLTFLICKTAFSQKHVLAKEKAISKIPLSNGDTLSIEELMAQNGLKGLSVAVFEDYKIIWADSWGVKYDSVPLDVNTAFSTASIAKPITATLFSILEEKGLIDLSIPVNNYLKRWKIPVGEYNKDTPITLEHLLSHTAGTTQGGFIDFYEGDEIPTILESIKGEIPNSDHDEIEITFKPGSHWKYSGGGYTIAMMALEDHLEKTLAELAQQYIFDALNLQNTTMIQPKYNPLKRATISDSLYQAGEILNLAKAHDNTGNVIRTGFPITPQVSASGLWSTPTDLSLFLIEIQKALNNKSKIISTSVANRVTEIVTLKVMRGWSLGWERRYAFGNLDWFSHGGANTGVGGHVYATMEEGKGIVLLGNGPNSIRVPTINLLRDNIIRTHKWGLQYDWENKKEIPEALTTKIVGRYEDLTFGAIFEIKDMNGKLYVPSYWNGVRNDLIHIGDNTFITNEVPGKFKFIFSEKDTLIEYSRDENVPSEIMYEKFFGKLPNEVVLEGGDYNSAREAYKKLQVKKPNHSLVQENSINRFGYQLIRDKEFDKAILIFKINTDLYPNSANVFDSLGEAYMLNGDKLNAIKNYKKSLELNPNNENAKKNIKEMSQ
ncbi:serine hydrolase [Ekhidna sp.]|uniref:serine hydrolase n=1 Tax=Ekhidna sp. TaxID=2608089 RepID=UPI0032997B69